MDTTAPPLVADLRTWMSLPAGDPTDGEVQLALDVAETEQAARCDTLVYGPDLFYACLRRAARVLAARSAPLGRADLGDLGAPALARWDAEIDAAEAPYLRGGFA